MKQSKEIKENWEGPENLDIYFCVILTAFARVFILGKETERTAESLHLIHFLDAGYIILQQRLLAPHIAVLSYKNLRPLVHLFVTIISDFLHSGRYVKVTAQIVWEINLLPC